MFLWQRAVYDRLFFEGGYENLIAESLSMCESWRLGNGMIIKCARTIALPRQFISASKTVAETIGKPEQYVMVTLSQAAMLMSGGPGAAAFVDVRSICGRDLNRTLSQKVCKLLNDALPGNRVYLNFTDFAANNWGWNGSTFA